MSKTLQLLAAVKEIFNRYAPYISFWRSPIDIKYPRGKYEIKKLNIDIGEKWLITFNLYDKDTFEKIIELADKLDEEVGSATFEAENFYFKFVNTNDRQSIEENDKTIARLMFTYEILVYRKTNY